MNPRHTAAGLFLSALVIAGCSGKRELFDGLDGAPTKAIDYDAIPDAVPRYEPRTRAGNPQSYSVLDQHYRVMTDSTGYRERGIASWYGTKFHGKKTANGETYDMFAMTAAHKTLPIPSYVRVTHLQNRRSIVVRINDRGPFRAGRIIDLSYTAAVKLGIHKTGTGPVEVQAIDTRAATPAVLESTFQGPVYLQVGSFSDRRNADRLHNELRRLALPLAPIQTRQQPSQTHYQVQVGPLESATDFARITQQLRQLGITPLPRVLPTPAPANGVIQ